ncbi:MAG TPA: DUF188 domain-containing protein [Alkalispirochaeta sp.]|nr:DUF188 domain-containing protein [Alkalispirochaeta sp.]
MERSAVVILVDGDSCPVLVRSVLVRASQRRGVAVRFFANQPMHLESGHQATVVRGETVDEALIRLVEQLVAEDVFPVVVTRDIPLAEVVLARGAAALNDRGAVFDAQTIAERRSLRDAAAEIRASGLESMSRRGGYGPHEKKAFADALDRTLTRLGV